MCGIKVLPITIHPGAKAHIVNYGINRFAMVGLSECRSFTFLDWKQFYFCSITVKPNQMKILTKCALLVICALFLNNMSVHAKTIMEGRIITSLGDTQEVLLQVPRGSGGINLIQMQFKVICCKSRDKKSEKTTIYPNEAIEVQILSEEETIRLVSVKSVGTMQKNRKHGGRLFVQLVTEGKINLYRYFDQQMSTANYGDGSASYTQMYSTASGVYFAGIDVDLLERIRSLRYKQDMAEFFSDCPALVEKIESGDFKYKQTPEAVELYNKTCG